MNNDFALRLLKRAEEQIKTDHGFSLKDRFIDSDETPVRQILQSLIMASMNWREEGVDLWSIGNRLQQEHGSGVVPFRCELECAVGLWKHVRENPELLAKLITT